MIVTELLEQLKRRAPRFDPLTSPAGRDTRDPYQRDLGRIIHSASFRRLQTKTQVMGTGEGDFHRTRLTHSLEVGQIGRGITWNLYSRVVDDVKRWLPSSELIEAICYAHDLGHPPYGHGGERALYRAMKSFGGFEGNAQNIRILTRLEKYYRGEGIQPTRRLLLGVLKYPAPYSSVEPKTRGPKPPKCYYDDDSDLIECVLSIFSEKDRVALSAIGDDGRTLHKSFDCSIMELADDIAYGVHDLEDGIGRNLLSRDEIAPKIKDGFQKAQVDKIREMNIQELINKLFSTDSCERKHAISVLVGYFVESVSVKRQDAFDSKILDFCACVPEHTRILLDCLSKDITFREVVNRREVQTLEYKGEFIIKELFRVFSEKPLLLTGAHAIDPFGEGLATELRSDENKNKSLYELDEAIQVRAARGICDFISGMTNSYAEKYFRRIFEPGYGSSTDEL